MVEKEFVLNGHAGCEPFIPEVSGGSEREFKDRVDYTASSKLAYDSK